MLSATDVTEANIARARKGSRCALLHALFSRQRIQRLDNAPDDDNEKKERRAIVGGASERASEHPSVLTRPRLVSLDRFAASRKDGHEETASLPRLVDPTWGLVCSG